ncbi:MAG: hypothetical protein DYH03_12420 [Nitrospira sp. NTP1]|nr:hypothetical protein [Nitrospira sp. NTP1]
MVGAIEAETILYLCWHAVPAPTYRGSRGTPHVCGAVCLGDRSDPSSGSHDPAGWAESRNRLVDPLATVVIYPSDHFVYPEERFLATVREAVQVAGRLQDRIVLLGVAPDRLERDYGWIVPGARLPVAGPNPILAVRTFIEKPTAQQADDALANHALWNTMVVVAPVKTLWELGQQCFPEMVERFERLGQAIGTSEEARVLKAIYRAMPARNFSSDLLQQAPDRVVVTELTNALWSDWGRPERIAEALRRIGRPPAFPLDVLASPFAPISIGNEVGAKA